MRVHRSRSPYVYPPQGKLVNKENGSYVILTSYLDIVRDVNGKDISIVGV